MKLERERDHSRLRPSDSEGFVGKDDGSREFQYRDECC